MWASLKLMFVFRSTPLWCIQDGTWASVRILNNRTWSEHLGAPDRWGKCLMLKSCFLLPPCGPLYGRCSDIRVPVMPMYPAQFSPNDSSPPLPLSLPLFTDVMCLKQLGGLKTLTLNPRLPQNHPGRNRPAYVVLQCTFVIFTSARMNTVFVK